ncbi:MAG: carbohydrate-binding domain-containing protein [Clostridiales bacterium]|nr:carbohydrate-binding domain-containing protein [Clostridiales bacterium]
MRQKRWMKQDASWKRLVALGLIGGLVAAQLTGCGGKTAESSGSGEAAEAQSGEAEGNAETGTEDRSGDETVEASDGATQAAGTGAVGVSYHDGGMTAELGEGGQKTVEYEEEDLDDSWDESRATTIVLSDSGSSVSGANAKVSGNTVEINDGGTFVVSGSLSDGQIRITASKGETVRLILNGVEISNSTTAPIYAEKKCKVILTLAEGTENLVSDGTSYVLEEGEDEPDSPIFVKGDLTINGSGSLSVQGNYQSGIRSKGNLLIVSGTIAVDCQDDGIKGKDSLVILDGDLKIRSVKDGLKSNNDESDEVGYIWIDGGTIAIAAQDDGIQAESALVISGGSIAITESDEALAGKTVDILGGLIEAVASDDGINSAMTVETEWEKMADQEGVYTRIAGGEIWLDASADGIDSNGDLYIEGGVLYLSGPTGNADGILDYNGTATLTGGTIFAAGSGGMMQTFGADSTQNYLVIYCEETQAAGTQITLTDADGNEMGSYAPAKNYQAVIISTPELETGVTYQVTAGEGSLELEVSAIETTSGNRVGGMGGDMGGGMRGGPGGGMGGGGRGFGNGEMPGAGEGEMPDFGGGDMRGGPNSQNGDMAEPPASGQEN